MLPRQGFVFFIELLGGSAHFPGGTVTVHLTIDSMGPMLLVLVLAVLAVVLISVLRAVRLVVLARTTGIRILFHVNDNTL